MVCTLSVGFFIGDIASGSPRDRPPLVSYAATSAVIPHVRLCTVLPRNRRPRLSCKHTTSLSHSRYALEGGSHNV
jgi:hypothetical protein